jgi:hypothetical protein
MPLFLDVEPGDTLRIGSGTTVRVERKRGQRTRLRIDSEYRVQFDRAADDVPLPGKPEPPVIRRPNPGRG